MFMKEEEREEEEICSGEKDMEGTEEAAAVQEAEA